MASYAYVPDEEMGGIFDSKAGPSIEFAERAVRLGFIRKVFGLLSAQLALTVAVTAAFLSSPGPQRFVASNPWTLWTALGASLGLLLLLSCSESARRSHPTNLIVLGAFTACQALLVAVASAAYATSTVLIAATLTLGITGCLTAYAMQTRRDFTASGGILFSLLFALVGAGLLAAIFPSRVAEVALAGLGAALFGAYISLLSPSDPSAESRRLDPGGRRILITKK